jgi:hypothetical protein
MRLLFFDAIFTFVLLLSNDTVELRQELLFIFFHVASVLQCKYRFCRVFSESTRFFR